MSEAMSDLLMFVLSAPNTGPGIVVTYSVLIEWMHEGAEVPNQPPFFPPPSFEDCKPGWKSASYPGYRCSLSKSRPRPVGKDQVTAKDPDVQIPFKEADVTQ